MSDYVKATDFASKDALLSGNPAKIIKGTEIDAEYNSIAVAIQTKADIASPTLTGTPTAPTATAGTNTTQIATTAFVNTADTASILAERSATATLTNKTLTTPVISSISNSGTITIPTGTRTLVARDTTDTLTNKTFTGFTETVFTITDGASVDLNPANGTIQVWTLGANRSPTATSFASGQSMTLMVDDGTARTITWPSVNWVGGVAPTLATSGYTVIVLWKVGSQLYGTLVGSVA